MKKSLGLLTGACLLATAAPMATAADEDGIHIGGALRTQYVLQDWSDASRDRGGEFDFELFRVNFDGTLGGMVISAEYRFYPSNLGSEGFEAPHHGWVGYNFDDWQFRIGLQQVPFGLLPFASHSWWFGIGYYVGLEDDYDVGVMYESKWENNHKLHVGFFKGDELGTSNPDRYSFDVVTADLDGDGVNEQDNEQVNTGSIRYAYTLPHADGSTEVGLSGQFGMLRNDTTDDSGNYWAAAAHLNGNYGPINLQLQAARYEYDPENPAGVSDDSVAGAFFQSINLIPAEANVFTGNIAYKLDVNYGPVDYIQFYNDLSIVDKEVDAWNTTWLNVTGALLAAGPVFTYFDIIHSRNAAFLGPFTSTLDDSVRMTEGGQGRTTRFNINIGYYF